MTSKTVQRKTVLIQWWPDEFMNFDLQSKLTFNLINHADS